MVDYSDTINVCDMLNLGMYSNLNEYIEIY